MRPFDPKSPLRHLGRVARRHAETCWLVGAGLCVALGLVCIVGLMGWAATWWMFVGTACFVWMAAFTWQIAEGRPFAPALPTGPVAGTIVVVTVGLTGLLGPAGLGVVALLVVLHPRVLSCVRVLVARATGRAPQARVPRVASVQSRPTPVRATPVIRDDEPFVVPDEVTLDDLCQAWCSSFVALQRARTVRARMSTVRMRAIYLDDLERRLGEDFGRWMTSVPRAAQDPRSFLRPGEADGLERRTDPERPASA